MQQTALHASHIENGAKMGEFAGYEMPLYYKEGVIKEHEWVRNHIGCFDVSHMGQVTIKGEGVAEFLEQLTPSAFQPKKDGRAQYTVLLNEDGGILDDLIITRISENKFYTVINAGRKEEDIAWIESQLPVGLQLIHHTDRSLIAVQGPWAERALHEVLQIKTHELPYMHMMVAEAPDGSEMFVSRVGYTGEDGFELSVFNDIAEEVWEKLLDHSEVKPAGLAARDSLRLEMGYALYGHEINENTSPVEAGSSWIISKNTTGYFGYERIQKELAEGPSRKLVGIKLLDKGVAREGAEIRSTDDEIIGALTSGGHSPSLQASIGMGYVPPDYAQDGLDIFVNVRGRNLKAKVCNLPFRPARTKSIKKSAV